MIEEMFNFIDFVFVHKIVTSRASSLSLVLNISIVVVNVRKYIYFTINTFNVCGPANTYIVEIDIWAQYINHFSKHYLYLEGESLNIIYFLLALGQIDTQMGYIWAFKYHFQYILALWVWGKPDLFPFRTIWLKNSIVLRYWHEE